jgi:murein DD-endopeptidase MepM/ murein hydrolase activator NlpD
LSNQACKECTSHAHDPDRGGLARRPEDPYPDGVKAFDLHTVPGIVRSGVAAGFSLAILLVVTAALTGRLRPGGGSDAAAGVPTGPPVPLLFPLEGIDPAKVGEGFDARRGTRQHGAVDVPAPRRTPVRAAADGVVRLTRHAGAGLTVEQDEASGRFCLIYAHLDGYPLGLRDQASVVRGQTIGYVGTSGNAPPHVPHLHFAVHTRAGGGCWSGAAVDPVPLFGPGPR